jgi:hypothetical protein
MGVSLNLFLLLLRVTGWDVRSCGQLQKRTCPQSLDKWKTQKHRLPLTHNPPGYYYFPTEKHEDFD